MSSPAKSAWAIAPICSPTGSRELDAGADVVVRAGWNNARWLDSKGNRVNLIALLKAARGKGLIDRPIWIKGSAKEPIALRLAAIRKPKQVRDVSIDKLKRHARDKGRNLRPETR
jgi:hypothetical protein